MISFAVSVESTIVWRLTTAPSTEPAPARRLRVVPVAVFLALVGTLLLEVWRPYFYLTDDNISSYLPVVTEMARKLWVGRWPFVCDHLYGGNFPILGDPGVFGVLSPWLLLCSPLALTDAYPLIVELVSLGNNLAIAAAFAWSAQWLRIHFRLPAPDWAIVLLAFSYTFTPFNLILGSSWIGFLNGQAAFPLLVVGFFHPSRAKALALMVGALLYALLGGHAHTFLVTALFSGLVAITIAAGERSLRAPLRLAAAGAIAGIILSPLLIPTLGGFRGSPRAAGVSAADASRSRIPAAPLAESYALGPFASAVRPGIAMHGADPVYNLSAAFALANGVVLAALVSLRRFPPLVVAMLACFAVAALAVVRPPWLAEILAQVPLLRSLQWPFRELWVMHAAAHLLALLAWRPLPARWAPAWRMTAAVGAGAYAFVFLNAPPTFYEFELDRRLILSGEAERFWTALTRGLPEPPRVIVSVPPQALFMARARIPHALLAAYNFPTLLGVVSESGYTYTSGFATEKADRPRPYYYAGAYTPQDARRLLAQLPGRWLVELRSIEPITFTVANAGGTRWFAFDLVAGETREIPAPPPSSAAPVPASLSPTP